MRLISPDGVLELVQAHRSEFQEADHYESYRHLMNANKAATDCSFSLVGGAASLRFGDYSTAEELLNIAKNCPGYNPHQKATALLLHGLLQWNFGDIDAANKDLANARDLEMNLGKSTGIDGSHEFVQFAEKVINKIKNGEHADSKWISNNSKLDIKTGDSIVGWE